MTPKIKLPLVALTLAYGFKSYTFDDKLNNPNIQAQPDWLTLVSESAKSDLINLQAAGLVKLSNQTPKVTFHPILSNIPIIEVENDLGKFKKIDLEKLELALRSNDVVSMIC